MITLLDTLGPAIWRASWQAAALALLVVLLLRSLWGTPVAAVAVSTVGCRPGAVAVRGGSSQSLERVQSGPLESGGERTADRRAQADATFKPVPHTSDSINRLVRNERESPRVADSAPESTVTRLSAPPESPSISSGTAMQLMPSIKDLFDAVLITRILSSFWLAGCLFFGLKLLANRARFASATFRPAVR